MKKKIAYYLKKYEIVVSFTLIAVFVFIFNYETVFGLDALIQDDYARFFYAINSESSSLINSFLQSGSFRFLNMYLMTVNVNFTRLFYLIVFTIPLSMVVFYFNRKYLDIGVIPALTAAILFNILPYQEQMIKFIDGSYPLRGLLFMFISLIIALQYLKTKKIYYLPAVLLFWFLTNINFAEMGILILPAILLLIIFYDEGSLKQKIFIAIIYLSVGFYKLYKILFVEHRAAATVTEHSFDAVLIRGKQFIARLTLLPESIDFYLGSHHISHFQITFGLILLVLLLGLIFYIRHKNILPAKHKSFLLFYAAFSILAVSPFLLVSPWFASRHIFASSLAFFVLIIYLLHLLLYKNISLSKTTMIIMMSALLLFSGIHRHNNQSEHNALLNRDYNRVCNVIRDIPEIMPESQFVITNVDVLTEGFFFWSSGFIAYCLNKPNVSGIVGRELSFYDPFNIEKRGYDYNMKVLDINKPLYAVQFDDTGLIYHQYFLRWFDAEKTDSQWIVYKRNNDTKLLEEFITGKGMEEYANIFNEFSLTPKDILWGQNDI